jgi:hypothetical protein
MQRREWILLTAGVAPAGHNGAFDSQNIMSPSIVKEGNRYFLFYAGGPSGPRNGYAST